MARAINRGFQAQCVIEGESMANKILTDEMMKAIGFKTKPVTYEIGARAIRKFAQAIDDPNPLFNDEQAARETRFGGMIAPPTFGRMLGGIFLKLPFQLPKRGLDGGSEWEFLQPIRPGDRITVQTKLADLKESEGKMGVMVFHTYEVSFTNQFDEVCVLQRFTLISYC
jgi:acyl dehydratase